VGKGWAKGMTAATDPRIARAAAGHRGKQYVRRTPPGSCRWPVAGLTTLPLAWSNEMAYIVGLTATDGCLVTGRRAINFKSSDRELVETYLSLLGRTNRVKSHPTKTGGTAYYTQFHDSALYEWFLQAGLTPRKSLTIGPLSVPDEFLFALVRGLLDGDGSVINKTYRADTGRRQDYFWEYLITSFKSASRPHLEWLRSRIHAATTVAGRLSQVKYKNPLPNRHPFFELRYGKRSSLLLLPMIYAVGAPCLERKRAIWLDYARRHNIIG
jgi:LAGLIDADG DNA endonuclease family protein